ncbi:MAG: ABC transporter permease [Candidatus Solibacter usitatus]|nr:ABC transporter permease [Candidatus Solibacter usitatus]
METVTQDIRYALRGFARNPVFTLTAVVAIALGIGATTAVFSVVDRILFRSLPYPDDERLVSLGLAAAPIDPQEFLPGTDYLEWRAAQTPFAALTTWSGTTDCDLSDHHPVRLSCAAVESSFLPTLGIQPILGRNFTRDEDRPGATRVVLLSYGIWRQRFGGDRGIVDKTIPLDGMPARVIGVLPADFELPTLASADLLIPQALDEARQQRPNMGKPLRAFARLKPGVTQAQAAAAMQPLFERSLQFVPAPFRKEVKFRLRSLRDRQVQDARLASWMLLGAVGAVLLIACANVANLLLARSVARRREMAIRSALGAGRARLVRQVLTESLTLALCGGAAGCALAYTLLRGFVAIAPEGIPRLGQASLDARVLGFTLIGSLISGVLFGIAPAVERPARSWFRQSLTAVQIAVSLILLSSAGLLLRSLWNLQNDPLGMRAENVVTASFVLSPQRYADNARQIAFFEELEKRLSRLPEGTSAITDSLPPSGAVRARPIGALRPNLEGSGGTVIWRYVTPGYFSALGIPIVRGRSFTEEDRNAGEDAVVLSQPLAARLFPANDAVGQRIGPGTVIGIAGEVKNGGLAEKAEPEYYVVRKHTADGTFQNQQPPYGWRRASLIVRSAMEPRALAEWVRGEVSALDPAMPLHIETMHQRVSQLAQKPRFNAALLGLFAGMGVLLAVIGLYGVIAFLVAQRTREIGIRMALGATPAAITKLVLGHAARWMLAGACVGVAGSFMAHRWLKALLFRVPDQDWLALGNALALLLGAALLAAWIPSRRAARVDPLVALRQE